MQFSDIWQQWGPCTCCLNRAVYEIMTKNVVQTETDRPQRTI